MELVPMDVLVRRLSTLTAVLAASAVLVSAGSAGSTDTVSPTLYVDYTMNCTFTITDDNGKRVSSIAPGTYQIQITSPVVFAAVDLSGINDFTACKSFAQFQLTGPGVNVFTTLQDGDEDKDVFKETFLASSTYTARDLNQPLVARAVFTTAASGSPTAPTSPYTPSSSSSKGTPSTDIVGSKVKKTATATTTLPLRGTLVGALSATGKPTLTSKGRTVSTLKSGRYTFSITDQDSKGGFWVQRLQRNAITLTGVPFVGKRTVKVDLKVGQWMFFTGHGKIHYFVVVGLT